VDDIMNSINYITIDEYLNGLSIDEKQSLQKLRDIIHSTIPDCKERIAIKICVFSINKDLVGFASQKNHLSFYTMSPSLVKKMKKELQGYNVSGATIHFTPQEPLSKLLIQKILRERYKEIVAEKKGLK
jgi:uncharacterized protein YdhG (YjbR/CyaY superfamily)